MQTTTFVIVQRPHGGVLESLVPLENEQNWITPAVISTQARFSNERIAATRPCPKASYSQTKDKREVKQGRT